MNVIFFEKNDVAMTMMSIIFVELHIINYVQK